MYITRIELRNYRNYTQENISFISKANVVIGNNAQGKTNLLEAAYLCGFGKSFRSSRDVELIKDDSPFWRVKMFFFKENREQTIELGFREDQKKQILINNVPLKSTTELIGKLNIVLFAPDDLKLIKGGPNERRRFLDREISHLYPKYMRDLIEYNKVLQQRNKLLKMIQIKKNKDESIDTLSVWDDQLIAAGTLIILRRLSYCSLLKDLANKVHNSISDHAEDLTLQYFSTIIKFSVGEYDKISSEFKKQMNLSLEKDIKFGYTHIGPHKDDLIIEINKKDTRKYASQGQQRTATLSLKLAEIEIVKQVIGESPILLLDDVMSELDVNRQIKLFESIKDVQTIITTTDLNGIEINKLAPFRTILVRDGEVLSYQEVIDVN